MNILIIKTGAMGDVLRCNFIAQALKEKYARFDPKIIWLTAENAIPLFVNNPYVTKVIAEKDKEKLRNFPFDLIINLEESKELCEFACSLRYKRIIGFLFKNGKFSATETAKEWFDMSRLGKKPQNDILKKKNRKTHKQIIGEIIGLNHKKYEPFLRLNQRQRRIAKEFLKRHNLKRTDLIIGINAGSADRWPKSLAVKKTVDLINKVQKKYGAKMLLFGGPQEIERNKKIMSLVKVPVIDTGCGNDLLEFPALISVCSLFITTDSLGLHVALALKRRTVCLVGPTSPAELDLYGLGEKVISKSKCICCYNSDCKSMEKIYVKDILSALEKVLSEKITILVTAFKEPTIGKAIESVLNQKTRRKYDVVVSAPDKETLDIAKKYAKKDKRVRVFKDPGKGKSYALNLIFPKLKSDIVILTDGDVYVNDSAIEEISKLFKNPEIGCITGRPVPVEDRKTKYGYWANFLFDAAHKLRKSAFDNQDFIECSGYLFAFRKNKINSIPLDVAEDTVIPYFFWEKGYRIGYAEKAEVYVKNVDNWKDWIKQKTRTSKAHETLGKYVDIKTTPRVKTFGNEARGISQIISYPKNLKEIFWTIQLVLARGHMWAKVFLDTKFRKAHYQDAWERVESTK